ncbi:pre-mRNA-processing factor 39-like isoform X2 [Paramacrobiotus metropolitanus]|uniref:pre-mRNA-processing factor 39-like isoform X2 n=1 Tax=Paramacrobiotus metropolitanus TaxID=2943436 RepID=UPI0024458882|nr:pre-mRNA-processing factor 39-like isoform X2 [Paramacrobiotus metropolitanus]
MEIPLPPELMDPDLSTDSTGNATVSSVGLYTNGRYSNAVAAPEPLNMPFHNQHSESSVVSASPTSDTTRTSASLDHNLTNDRDRDSTFLSSASTPSFSRTASQSPPALPPPGVEGGGTPNAVVNKDPDANKPPELKKLWKPVRTNHTDFNAWTTLLTYVELQENVEAMREAYDGFLLRYPYCYGYWKKYHELEKRFGQAEQSERVLEQGVTAIPLSIDLWMYYINFAKERYRGVAGEGLIRQLFGRAVEAMGLDFKSDELWDAYIEWEASIGQRRNVFTIYERLLRVPTLHYHRHFEEFQKLVMGAAPAEVMSSEDLDLLRPLVPEGEDPDSSMRQMIIESRRPIYKLTEAEVAKRWNFESNIRRPYFHVKPLEASQLKNWSEYLAFEMEEKQMNRIVFLFERCLVACALYEEFWRKYLTYLKSENQTDYIRYAYQRVCTYHLSNRVGLHLEWAAFEEEEGSMDNAVLAVQNGLKQLPQKPILALRHVGILRRMQSDPEQVMAAFDSYVSSAEDAGLVEFFLVKEARYQLKLKNDKERAMQILRLGLKKDPTSVGLLTALLDCELQQMPLNVPALVALYEEILAIPELGLEQRMQFLERKLHNLEDFSLDIKEIHAAHQQYYALSMQLTRGKKRAFGEDDDELTGESSVKKPFEAPSSLPTTPMTTPAVVPLASPLGYPAVTVAPPSWPPMLGVPPPAAPVMPAMTFPGYPPPTAGVPAPLPTWPRPHRLPTASRSPRRRPSPGTPINCDF